MSISAASNGVLRQIFSSRPSAGNYCLNAASRGELDPKRLKDSVNQTTALNIGIEQAAYNSLSGADGITLSYYRTVINGVPYIIVTGLVASATAGAFNNIVLVDGHGNAIPNQELISGGVSSAQGSTFSILLPVPAGSGISQTIKVQTQQVSNGQTTVVSTATSSSTLTTTEGVGIVNMLPGAVYLTATNPEQTITFSNTGDAAAQLQSLIASNPNIEVVFTPGSLASGGTATAILKLKDPTLPATSGGVEFTYNNGQNEVSSSAVVDQNVNPAPTPSPSPTPTPTPPGPPVSLPTITITNLAGNTSSMMGTTPITFTATISGGGSSTVSAALANSVTGTIVSNPSPCILTVGGATTSCTFSIVPWYTGFANSIVGTPSYDPFTPTGTEITLSATNGATITGTEVTSDKISYTITTPYVYLAAPEEGAASATNTGITWGTGGTVATRFSAGTQASGGDCTDSLKDNLTGLEWAKNAIIGFTATNYGSLITQPTYTNTDPNLNLLYWSNNDAVTAITNMNNATIKLCEQSDWRLPTQKELLSLFNYSAPSGNQANWLISQGFTGVAEYFYWSSTTGGNGAWDVNMSNGDSGSYDINYRNNVWPVRGGQ